MTTLIWTLREICKIFEQDAGFFNSGTLVYDARLPYVFAQFFVSSFFFFFLNFCQQKSPINNMNYNYKLKISLKHIIDYNYTSQT